MTVYLMKEFKKVRVRFAPSPTGYLHVGSFRTALFNWLFARKNCGDFILRIEDTDRQRSSGDFLKSQLADMRWMGLDWDEGPDIGGDFGPYYQSERTYLYNKFAKKLLDSGRAYHCYCTPEELKEQRKKNPKSPGYQGACRNLTESKIKEYEKQSRKPCVRLLTPDSGFTVIVDVVKEQVEFDNRLLDDFVIMKSDGMPTYNFAVVVDDRLMGVTHVIRGDEHMSNTPKQGMIYDALDFPRPVFCHIPIILNTDRTKLSKRKGAVHLLDYRERGYLKEALLNYSALLGWAPKDDREIMPLEDILDSFSLKGVTKHPAVFDEQKLEWMNSQYLARLPHDELVDRCIDFLRKNGVDTDQKSREWFDRAVAVYGERVKTLGDYLQQFEYYFNPVEEYNPKGVKRCFKADYIPDALNETASRIERSDRFDKEFLEEMLRGYAGELEVSAGKLIQAVRLAVSGRTATPPIFDVMVLTGKETLINRLRKASVFIRERKAQKEKV